MNQQRLDLQENEESIYICKGRVEGEHPIFLSYESV